MWYAYKSFKQILYYKKCKKNNECYSKEYSLIGKIGSFKLQISSSSLGALVVVQWGYSIVNTLYCNNFFTLRH